MIRKYIFPLAFIFSLSCNGQKNIKQNDDVINAKWYYYSYAMQLNGYDKKGVELQPLLCDIKALKSIIISKDTTKILFELYYKDSLNICYLKPLGLNGITVIRHKLYSPIYHKIIFDNKSDSAILVEMDKQNLLLQTKISQNEAAINPWLLEEAKRRKALIAN